MNLTTRIQNAGIDQARYNDACTATAVITANWLRFHIETPETKKFWQRGR